MELLLVKFTVLTMISAVATDPTRSKSKLVLEIIISTNLPDQLFQSQLLYIVQWLSSPQVSIPAMTIPVWMSLGEPQTTLTIITITTIVCVIIMWSGMAGTGCSTMVKILRCQNHV
ncbi:hypothetical protein PO909_012391 [Leuciscus waleckii]